MSNNSPSYRIQFISGRWEHHSTHSGYDQLAKYLGGVVKPLDLTRLSDKWVPGRVAVRLADRSGVKHYTYKSFYDELAAFRDLIRHPQTIYHLLYGEYSYRYLGSLASLTGSKVVATFHQPPDYLPEIIYSYDYLRRLDAVIVVGTNQIPFFAPIVGRERVFWVPHGVSSDVFCPPSGEPAEREPNGLCLFVGSHKRDFQTLRRVAELLWEQDSSIRLVVVTQEEMRKHLEGLPNVEVCHHVPEPELVRLYQVADVLLEPMDECTANNAILEGLSCGLPVLATDIGGARDYINECCGFLFSPKDAEGMAQAALELINDRQKRSQLSQSARLHALEFDWNIIANKMSEIYSGLWD